MSWLDRFRLASISLLALGAYLQITEWVDLYPWNNIRGGNGQELLDAAMALVSLILVVMLWRRSRVSAFVAIVLLIVWGGLQVATWWAPYFLGASQAWTRIYQVWFSQTTAWLPRTADRLPPDASHIVLQGLILMALGASVAASIQRPRMGS